MFTDANGNDASYEVANLEKMTFRLTNDSGVTIGTASMWDNDDGWHTSDYSAFYESHVTQPDKENLPYSAVENGTYTEYVLTDEKFGAKGDMRIANGGTFHIQVEHAYDYTQQDEYFPEVENKLDISGKLSVEVKKSHARVPDPNSAVTVTPTRNDQMVPTISNLDDDTVVGLTVDTGYSLSDAYKVIYYVYELTGATGEPVVKDHKDNENDEVPIINKTVDGGYWAANTICKTKTVMVTNAPDAGGSIPLWTVHFNETDDEKPTVNKADNGEVLFERGKVYFIRYEVVTNGSLEDTGASAKTKTYPHCAYDYWGADHDAIDLLVPFYRSNVFGLERQEPKIHRYLWDTVTSGTTIQQWKYLLDDPDNAILAYADFDKDVVAGTITEYANFEDSLNENVPGTNMIKDNGNGENTSSSAGMKDKADSSTAQEGTGVQGSSDALNGQGTDDEEGVDDGKEGTFVSTEETEPENATQSENATDSEERSSDKSNETSNDEDESQEDKDSEEKGDNLTEIETSEDNNSTEKEQTQGSEAEKSDETVSDDTENTENTNNSTTQTVTEEQKDEVGAGEFMTIYNNETGVYEIVSVAEYLTEDAYISENHRLGVKDLSQHVSSGYAVSTIDESQERGIIIYIIPVLIIFALVGGIVIYVKRNERKTQ